MSIFQLHKSKYDTDRALQSLVKRPFPKTSRMNWSEDDTVCMVSLRKAFSLLGSNVLSFVKYSLWVFIVEKICKRLETIWKEFLQDQKRTST